MGEAKDTVEEVATAVMVDRGRADRRAGLLPLSTKVSYTLELLLSRVSARNLHREVQTGAPQGREAL